MKTSWNRLIRFEATDGRILRGEPILPPEDYDVGLFIEQGGLLATIIEGSNPFDGDTRKTTEVVTVKRLLSPLAPDEVPIVRCIGLNYAKHVREAGMTAPPFPSFFFKPNTAIIGPNENIRIPKIAQDDQADYEGELCIVIGKDAKDVSAEEALDYVGAYTAGNDVSSRKLQIDPKFAGTSPQVGFSKGFDTFLPLGPCLVSSQLMTDPSMAQLTTKVNGELRQNEGVKDLLFDCAYLVSYLSQGTTLQRGSIIITGTPGGIGHGMKPPQYLKPGDVVDVSISGIGTLRNVVAFE